VNVLYKFSENTRIRLVGGKLFLADGRMDVKTYDMVWYILAAVGLTPGCSSTVHIYTQTTH